MSALPSFDIDEIAEVIEHHDNVSMLAAPTMLMRMAEMIVATAITARDDGDLVPMCRVLRRNGNRHAVRGLRRSNLCLNHALVDSISRFAAVAIGLNPRKAKLSASKRR